VRVSASVLILLSTCVTDRVSSSSSSTALKRIWKMLLLFSSWLVLVLAVILFEEIHASAAYVPIRQVVVQFGNNLGHRVPLQIASLLHRVPNLTLENVGNNVSQWPELFAASQGSRVNNNMHDSVMYLLLGDTPLANGIISKELLKSVPPGNLIL
jgi:hypothetical protein